MMPFQLNSGVTSLSGQFNLATKKTRRFPDQK